MNTEILFVAPTPRAALRMRRNLAGRGYRARAHGRIMRVQADIGDKQVRDVAARYAALELLQ